MNFKILYHFGNEQFQIIEIKRTDLGEETDKAKLYYWLSLGERVVRLTFKSMEEGFREFDENCWLLFAGERAILKETDENSYHDLTKYQIDETTIKRIQDFLAEH